MVSLYPSPSPPPSNHEFDQPSSYSHAELSLSSVHSVSTETCRRVAALVLEAASAILPISVSPQRYREAAFSEEGIS